jgi:hypothetical protein
MPPITTLPSAIAHCDADAVAWPFAALVTVDVALSVIVTLVPAGTFGVAIVTVTCTDAPGARTGITLLFATDVVVPFDIRLIDAIDPPVVDAAIVYASLILELLLIANVRETLLPTA